MSIWLTAALLMAAAGYAVLGVSVFQKNNHVDLTRSARWLLFPCLAGAWLSKNCIKNNHYHRSAGKQPDFLAWRPRRIDNQRSMIKISVFFSL
jgi:hypothetical protein